MRRGAPLLSSPAATSFPRKREPTGRHALPAKAGTYWTWPARSAAAYVRIGGKVARLRR